MKTLKQIREAKSGGKEAYQKFFNSLLKKFGVKSPAELDDAKKKEFYDAIDKGWKGDNEKTEKNERYDDPDNLDPETTVDSDEDMADKAASQINASYGKMNASKKKKMNAAYHKESVKEAKKLKPGKGKAELDINWDGDRSDIKFATTKYKIKMKPHSDGAIISGDKAKLLAYLQGQDYAMDPEDIEDLYPELMENSSYPKPLSIIRQVKEFSGDAETVRRKRRRFEADEEEAHKMNEKMVMCEHCGKMHEEGACGDMNESEIHLDAKSDKFKKIKKSQWAAIKKKYNVTIDSDSTGSWAGGKPADLHKFAMAMGMSKDDIKKTYNHITPDYKGASSVKNRQREEVEEAMSMKSIGLKGASKRSRETGRKAKEGPALRGAKLGKSQPVLNRSQENEIHKIANKHSGNMEKAMKEIEKMRVWKGKGIQDHPYVMDVLKKANESVNEAMSKGQMAHDKDFMHKKLKGNNDKSMKITTAKALKIKVDGNTLVMTPKQDKLMQKHKVTIRNDSDGDISVWGKGNDVYNFMAAMGQKVEEVEEKVDVDGRLIGFKSAQRRSEGEKQKGKVIVDRRTKGYKEAKLRSEKAKAKREAKKKEREFAEKYPSIDYAYGDDAELRKTMEAASKVLMGETAANAVAHGGVDMAPNAGKKKKDKEKLMAKRGY